MAINYELSKAPQKSKSYKSAKKASLLNTGNKTKYSAIIVNKQTELVIATSYLLKGKVTILIATVDETELNPEEIKGITEAFVKKYLAKGTTLI